MDRILSRVLFILPVILVALLGVHTLTSVYQDIGRHITLGKIIWETRHIPETNLFSYTHPGFPFLNHHWLSEVVLYLGDQLVGLKGLIALKALVVAGAFGLAFAAAWRSRIAVPAALVGISAALIMVERTDVRPEVLSFLFLGWFLFVLYRSHAHPTSDKLLLTLPIVQLLWVNSHIYFFMGPFSWLAYCIGRWAIAGSWRVLVSRKILVVTALLVLATLLNPHGLEGAIYPFKVFGNYGYSVAENKSPAFLRSYGFPHFTSNMLYLGLGIAALGFFVNRKQLRGNMLGLLTTGATAVLALTMVRNVPLFALCMLPATLKNLDGWLFTPSESGRASRPPIRTGRGWLIALLALFGANVVSGQFYEQAQLGRQFGLIVPNGYQRPVDFFRAANLKGPIFNNFDIGSYLIWKLPEEPVFIDGRPEAYPADFIQNTYIPMQENAAVWERKREEYGISTIFWNTDDITPWSQLFVARITYDPQWKLVYQDQGVIILVRK